jgi:glycerol kinase
MRADGAAPASLRVDGGMVVNDWFMQCLADTLGMPVERPRFTETTVLGAAALAGLGAGLHPSLEALGGHWQRDRIFEPAIGEDRREAGYAGWRDAVARVRSDR